SSQHGQEISIVVIGHADSGKSTTNERLTYECGGVNKRTIERAGIMNTAWEALKASQRKGPPLSLEEMRRVSMGHEETRTAGQLDCAVLTVASGVGESESGVVKNRQTRDYAQQACTLGVRQLMVAVNKVDITEPAYRRARFEETSKEVKASLKKIG
ncbi:hypothetical protein J1605_000961, partial [Eschrichtius robustus]